jgi:hypothetical protein
VDRSIVVCLAALALPAAWSRPAVADGGSVTAVPQDATADIAVPGSADESSLRAADREQTRILVEQDEAAYREFVHRNYVQNGPADRVLRRRQAVDRFGSPAAAVDRFERTVEAITITGNVGVVTGGERLSPALAAGSARLPEASVVERRFTNVYLYERDRWRLLARQVTPVGVTAPVATPPILGAAARP